MVNHSGYGSLPSAEIPSQRPRSQRNLLAVSVLVLGLACVILAVIISGAHSRDSLLSKTENDALKALQSSDRLLASSSIATDNLVANAVKKVEDKALGKALKAQKRAVQGLAETGETSGDGAAEEGEEEDDGYKPMFYAHYKKGMLGLGATSKWVSADHPEGHKDCKLHDIDCDELWPWGKVHVKHETHPAKRHGKLGDNMIGTFGEDDRIVKTEDSGLLPRVSNDKDHFDHWPAESEKNKELLYGSIRHAGIFDTENGVGDELVPTATLDANEAAHKEKNFPLADLVFGSWEQGFHKPHDHDIRYHLSMFDQPYRQHMSAARGDGHVVYKDPHQRLGTPESASSEGGGAGGGGEAGAGAGDTEFTPDQKNGFINAE